MATFVAHEPFDESHPTALAIYCSDGRFTNAVEELLHRLGHPRLDTLTIPGGPGLLNPVVASFLDYEAIQRGAAFLIRGHKIKQVVLLAHAGCGYYRERFRGQRPEEIHARQVADLRDAARTLRDVDPALGVALYYCRTEGGRVAFDLVPPEAR